MGGFKALGLMIAGFALAGCTSDRNAPVNQAFPIRQIDQFFDSLAPPPGPPSYSQVPGYAPAYPPYE